MAGVQGTLTIVEVSADGTTYSPLCVYNNEATVDYGKYSINKEFCMSNNDPEIALGDLEFDEQTYTHLWDEGDGSAGNLIVKNAHLSPTAKDIHIRVTANNSKGTNGTQYDAIYKITGYKHTFIRGEVNKTEWSCEQLTQPTEVVAA